MNTRDAASNPFRVSQFEQLPWIENRDSIENLYHHWQENNFRGQINGHHGSGKTTLANLLIEKATDEGHHCLALFANCHDLKKTFKHWQEQLKGADNETIILLDGLGHAPWLKRRKWLKSHPKVLVITHEKIAKIEQLIHLESDINLLENLVTKLAGSEGLKLLKDKGSAHILKQHEGNLREVFRELYHLWRKGY